MKKLALIIVAAFALLRLLDFGAQPAQAQVTFDPANYKALVDADSPDTIAPGTTINLENWQRYKRFMPPWLQIAFQGQYHWKVGPEPEYAMRIGPTVHYKLPTKYLSDTEKYAGQTRLVQSGDDVVWQGYVAGIPFPDPHEPDMATKVLYDIWAFYKPFELHFTHSLSAVDKYANWNLQEFNDTFYTVGHLSDGGLPTNQPYADGIWAASRFTVEFPEQSKYTTELTRFTDDPHGHNDQYVFLPSLRRSLRLSDAARCSPILGTDFVEDDNVAVWRPINFSPVLLGKKKVLAAFLDSPEIAGRHDSYVDAKGSFPVWPKASLSHWQVRPMYVLDLQWRSEKGRYCFSHRVMYLDAELMTHVDGATESYDNDGKFWKLLTQTYVPQSWDGGTMLTYGPGSANAYDFQTNHATAGVAENASYDSNLPAELRDAQTMMQPGSLSRIMK